MYTGITPGSTPMPAGHEILADQLRQRDRERIGTVVRMAVVPRLMLTTQGMPSSVAFRKQYLTPAMTSLT